MKKRLNPIEEYAAQIVREIGHWNYILENGCNDPFWPDGTNLNLTRNHIISYKREIADRIKQLEEFSNQTKKQIKKMQPEDGQLTLL